MREEARATRHKDVTYTKHVGSEVITITAKVPAQGDFTNDYMLNSSIDESNTQREYYFDRATGRLTGIKIDFIGGKKETTIVRLCRIEYEASIPDNLFDTPENIAWNDLTNRRW